MKKHASTKMKMQKSTNRSSSLQFEASHLFHTRCRVNCGTSFFDERTTVARIAIFNAEDGDGFDVRVEPEADTKFNDLDLHERIPARLEIRVSRATMTDLLAWGKQKDPPADDELSWLCQLVELRPSSDDIPRWSVGFRGYDARFSINAGLRGLLKSQRTIPQVIETSLTDGDKDEEQSRIHAGSLRLREARSSIRIRPGESLIDENAAEGLSTLFHAVVSQIGHNDLINKEAFLKFIAKAAATFSSQAGWHSDSRQVERVWTSFSGGSSMDLVQFSRFVQDALPKFIKMSLWEMKRFSRSLAARLAE